MGAAESTPTPAGPSLPQFSMQAIKNGKSDPKLSMVAVGTIDNASAFAVQEGNKMAKLYGEVAGMSNWSLFFDTKSFFGYSDPDEMRKEIKKYYDFFGSVRTVLKNVRSGDDSGIDHIDEIVDELYEKLEEMTKAAESGMESTNSITLYTLHQEFTTKHEKLENMIRRVESVGLRQKQKMLTSKWEEAMKVIEKLTDELKAATSEKKDLAELVREMKKENEKSKREREQMLEENREILTLLRQLRLNRE